MRLTDAQAAWNVLATEYNTLSSEIRRLNARAMIVGKKSTTGKRVLIKAKFGLLTRLVEISAEMDKMKGPDDEEESQVQTAAIAR